VDENVDEEGIEQLMVYPNPVEDEVTITYSNITAIG
jgi:hypothetical protein